MLLVTDRPVSGETTLGAEMTLGVPRGLLVN